MWDWPIQRGLGFGNKTQMRYLCKIIADDCAYACAPCLVQLKWIHCHTITWVNSVNEDTTTIACIVVRVVRYYPINHQQLPVPNQNSLKQSCDCLHRTYLKHLDDIRITF